MSLEQLRGIALVVMVALCAPLTAQKSQLGCYRQPAIWNDTIVFVAEGDLWRFDGAGKEATALTADYPGTSKTPMSWKGRIYFALDRDGVMNLWSMNERGGDLKQHTKHRDYEVLSPSLSNGEAFAEGFRRLGLGKVMGTRTWGGEVWLSSTNTLVDRGTATAAETGVYGPEGQWLIEGHGVDPDIVVDNLPHETHSGRDAQRDAAIRHLQDLIKTKPIPVPPPPYPIKR
jgi:hypothetical protein